MINQTKQMRQFDGSASTFKKIQKTIKCEPLEQRQVLKDFVKEQKGSKAEFVFKSKTDRFADNPNSYLNKSKNPGPSDYNAQEPNYINKGLVE